MSELNPAVFLTFNIKIMKALNLLSNEKVATRVAKIGVIAVVIIIAVLVVLYGRVN